MNLAAFRSQPAVAAWKQASPPTTIPMTTPTVHLNGTSHHTLFNGYLDAVRKHRDAAKAFDSIEFNARDYYPQGPEAWTQAAEQRQAINQKLRDIKDYLDTHLQALDSQSPPTREA